MPVLGTPDERETLEAPAWQLDAACRDMPTDLFFPIGHGEDAQAQANQAKAVCRACLVRSTCLDYALAGNMLYGVFGGMSEEERKDLRRSGQRSSELPGALSEPA